MPIVIEKCGQPCKVFCTQRRKGLDEFRTACAKSVVGGKKFRLLEQEDKKAAMVGFQPVRVRDLRRALRVEVVLHGARAGLVHAGVNYYAHDLNPERAAKGGRPPV